MKTDPVKTKVFVRSVETVKTVRADFIIALIPVTIWAIIRFGLHAVELISVSTITTFISDIIIRSIIERKIIRPSLYSIYVGLFLGLILYPSTSVLIAGVAGIISAFILNILGGENKCIVFAPIAARFIAFELIPMRINKPENMPLEKLFSGDIPTEKALEYVLGTAEGAIGAVSLIAIALGALYLIIRRCVDFRSAVSYIISVTLLYYLFPIITDNGQETVLYAVLASDIAFVAVFAMTNFATTPKSTLGKYSRGIICAVLTFILRSIGVVADGVMLSLMITDMICALCSHIAIEMASVKEAKNAK